MMEASLQIFKYQNNVPHHLSAFSGPVARFGIHEFFGKLNGPNHGMALYLILTIHASLNSNWHKIFS